MINNKHPDYNEKLPDWIKMRDAYGGEKYIKLKSTEYLPATASQVLDGMGVNEIGRQSYDAYKLRAVYPDYVHTAIESYLGLLHNKPTVITLPPEMEFMRQRATINGDTLANLLRRIHHEQLLTGRLGVLLDLPNDTKTTPEPYLALYKAEHILNWDDGSPDTGINALNLVVLDESRYARQGFSWVWQNRFRVLTLGDVTEIEPNYSGAVYAQQVVSYDEDESTLLEDNTIVPKIYNKPSQRIPFVIINSKDVLSVPDVPPLLALANIALAIYRAEADYRHSLYMQGQDTLVVIGGAADPDDETRVGAGSKIDINIGGDAKYIGVSSSGLSEMRQSLENDRAHAQAKAGQMLSNKSTQESGDALRLRMMAQTANLTQIAITAAYGLESILKQCAEWLGADPDKVSVTPNLDFVNTKMMGQDFVQLQQARAMHLPLCDESVHNLLRSQNLTTMDYSIESALASKEWEDNQRRAAELAAEMAAKSTPPMTTDGENKPRPDGSSDYAPPSARKTKPENPSNTLKQGASNG